MAANSQQGTYLGTTLVGFTAFAAGCTRAGAWESSLRLQDWCCSSFRVLVSTASNNWNP